MIVVPGISSVRRLAAIGLVAGLVAACNGVPLVTPSPQVSGGPTLSPTTPPFSLAPSPSGCPTSAPAAMTSGTATVTMKTNFGDIVIKVDSSLGPNAAGDFLALARCGYYNDVIFHRVLPKFVIQAGDGTYARLPDLNPEKFGTGGPDWTIKDDPVKTTYKRGTVAMARIGGTANSANVQFFIVLDDSAAASLGSENANNYAIFGDVTSGMDVVDRIAAIPTGGDPDPVSGEASRPLQPAVILATTVTTP
jgi:peptidyl-prolyl cis-trans isomerase B (cyclophilin B)